MGCATSITIQSKIIEVTSKLPDAAEVRIINNSLSEGGKIVIQKSLDRSRIIYSNLAIGIEITPRARFITFMNQDSGTRMDILNDEIFGTVTVIVRYGLGLSFTWLGPRKLSKSSLERETIMESLISPHTTFKQARRLLQYPSTIVIRHFCLHGGTLIIGLFDCTKDAHSSPIYTYRTEADPALNRRDQTLNRAPKVRLVNLRYLWSTQPCSAQDYESRYCQARRDLNERVGLYDSNNLIIDYLLLPSPTLYPSYIFQ